MNTHTKKKGETASSKQHAIITKRNWRRTLTFNTTMALAVLHSRLFDTTAERVFYSLKKEHNKRAAAVG